MPSPEMPRGPETEPRPDRPEGYAESLRVQAKIVGRFPDEADRLRWFEENAPLFRHLFEKDDEFRKLVLDEDADAAFEMLEKKKMQ
jgi:hypothetical protein